MHLFLEEGVDSSHLAKLDQLYGELGSPFSHERYYSEKRFLAVWLVTRSRCTTSNQSSGDVADQGILL